MRDRTDASGFTLIELIMVLLVSVLSLTALSSRIFSGNPNQTLRSNSFDMVSALRLAQTEAIAQQKPVSVTFDIDSKTYALSESDKIYRLNDDIAISLVVAEDEFTSGKQAKVVFFADGSSTGGRIKLELQNLFRQIDINWITGHIKISHEN
ncbi:MAG: type II secretion system protein GspH [Methylococcaceae bacterium]|jgi:general secretion pathway protein H|nr:type II secretion system protein GspH [Methylococcaceae bacterium]